MDKIKTAGCAFALLRMLILNPVWYYIWWSILKIISAPDLLFYLFWSYVPISFVLAFIEVMAKELLEQDK